MRKHEAAQKGMEQEEAWDLLPWYVNGTLSEADSQAVEAHLAGSASLRAELAAQKRLSTNVQALDSLDVQLERSLGALRQRIRAETSGPSQPNMAGPSGAFHALSRLVRFDMRMMLPLGAAAAASIALFVAIQGPSGDVPAPYTTLTRPSVSSDAPQLRVKVSGDATETAIDRLLKDHALRIVEGPSPTGVYTLELTADGNVAAIAAAVSDSPIVEFAAVRAQP